MQDSYFQFISAESEKKQNSIPLGLSLSEIVMPQLTCYK